MYIRNIDAHTPEPSNRDPFFLLTALMLQHTAQRCTHAATHRNTPAPLASYPLQLQYPTSYCITLRPTALQLQHTATRSNTLQRTHHLVCTHIVVVCTRAYTQLGMPTLRKCMHIS